MANVVTWFEIAVRDIEKASKFYGKIFGTKLAVLPDGNRTMAMFPAQWDKGEIGGALVAGRGVRPGSHGTVVYLNGGKDLQKILDRVRKAGGKVLLPKTPIPMEGAGFMAFFSDPDGNRVGLSSPK